MEETGERQSETPLWVRLAVPLTALAIGMVLMYYPMLFSGLRQVLTDRIDTRLNNYILEHGYQWLRGDPLHRSFWDPPVFYPAKNTLAYSETLVGVAPFYWIWRVAGIAPDTSFQLWMLTIGVLNFGAAYLPLRRYVGLSPFAASAGAFLFAFSGPRIAHLAHQQLLGQFYSPLALCAAVEALRGHLSGASRVRVGAWIVLVGVLTVAQLYACYYLGWFLCLAYAVSLFWIALLPEYRTVLRTFLARHLVALVLAGAVSAMLVQPLALHYAVAGVTVPKRHFEDTFNTMPRWYTWLFTGRANWLYGWTAGAGIFSGLYLTEPEEWLSIGYASWILAFVGLWRQQRYPWVRLSLLVFLSVLLYTGVASCDFDVCRFQFRHIPGAMAMRASSRVILLLLIPAALGLSLTLEGLLRKRRVWLAAALALLCMLEQGRSIPSYDKHVARAETTEVARRVTPGSQSFFLVPLSGHNTLDAMWATRETGIPTIDGHSGNDPPGWRFPRTDLSTPKEREALYRGLARWQREHDLDPKRTCVIWRDDPAKR